MVSDPSFVIDLYSNYDCGLYSVDLFDMLAKFLTKNSLPEAGSYTPLHVYSFNILLAILDQLSERAEGKASTVTTQLPDPAHLLERKQRKAAIQEGVKLFNESPKKGVQYLHEKGVFDQSMFAPSWSWAAVSNFLRRLLLTPTFYPFVR